MRKLYALLIITIMLFSACQKTPEKSVVENKGDGELEAAIAVTAPPTADTLQYTAEQKLYITDTRMNDAKTVTININADVILPDEETITVARLGKYYYTQEEVDRMIGVFFGRNLTFYDPFVSTKADIEVSILKMQLKLTDDEALLNSDMADASGVTDLDELRRMQNEQIEEQKKLLAGAPEEKPEIKELDIDKGIYVLVDNGSDYRGYVTCSGPDARFLCIICSAFGENTNRQRKLCSITAIPIDMDIDNPELYEARKAAQNLIDNMGIEGVKIGNVYKSLDNIGGTPVAFGDVEEVLASDREYYVFCFERIVGERTLDYTFYDGTFSQIENDIPYEKLEVWVEGDKIVQFRWYIPAEVTKIINDNVALQTDYEEALDLAVNNLFAKYTYIFEREEAESIDINISSVEFEMVRLKEKDTKEYIVVPAWKIYGTVREKLTEEYKKRINSTENPETGEMLKADDYAPIHRNYPNIVTVNALDGSIIDMDKGY